MDEPYIQHGRLSNLGLMSELIVDWTAQEIQLSSATLHTLISENMSVDEDTELRDLVVQALESNGVLGKIRVRETFVLCCHAHSRAHFAENWRAKTHSYNLNTDTSPDSGEMKWRLRATSFAPELWACAAARISSNRQSFNSNPPVFRGKKFAHWWPVDPRPAVKFETWLWPSSVLGIPSGMGSEFGFWTWILSNWIHHELSAMCTHWTQMSMFCYKRMAQASGQRKHICTMVWHILEGFDEVVGRT